MSMVASSGKDFGARYLFLPIGTEELSGSSSVEVVQFSGLTSIDSPCFTVIQLYGENHSTGDLDLCL